MAASPHVGLEQWLRLLFYRFCKSRHQLLTQSRFRHACEESPQAGPFPAPTPRHFPGGGGDTDVRGRRAEPNRRAGRGAEGTTGWRAVQRRGGGREGGERRADRVQCHGRLR